MNDHVIKLRRRTEGERDAYLAGYEAGHRDGSKATSDTSLGEAYRLGYEAGAASPRPAEGGDR